MAAPRMTKQDFEFVAKILAEMQDSAGYVLAVTRFADHFAATNPLFNRQKFIRACKGKK